MVDTPKLNFSCCPRIDLFDSHFYRDYGYSDCGTAAHLILIAQKVQTNCITCVINHCRTEKISWEMKKVDYDLQ